jgi:hypothetical protein
VRVRFIFTLLLTLSLLITPFVAPALGKEGYGLLRVISEDDQADIYVDGLLAGKSPVTIEDILPGSHYIKVISGPNAIFNKLIYIKEGQQETVVANPSNYQESPEKPTYDLNKHDNDKNEKPSTLMQFFVDYGRYSLTLSAAGSSLSSIAPKDFYGFGAEIKKLLKDGAYYSGGFHYYSKVAPIQVSYFSANYGIDNGTTFGEFGLNMPLWQVDGYSVGGSIGYQVTLGFNMSDNVSFGAKYVVCNGSYDYVDPYYYTTTPVTITLTQPVFYISIH